MSNPITRILDDPNLSDAAVPKLAEVVDCHNVKICDICAEMPATAKYYDVYCCTKCLGELQEIINHRKEIPASPCDVKSNRLFGQFLWRCQKCHNCRLRRNAEEAVKRRGDSHLFVGFDLPS